MLTTDDDAIVDTFRESPVKVIGRPKRLARDDTPIKPVVEHAVSAMRFYPSDDIVLLYPTYPGRTWDDIKAALHWYQQKEASTMLCAQPATAQTPTHLAIDVDDDDLTATHPLSDDAYRRQDAQGVIADTDRSEDTLMELSHFVCVFKVGALTGLNENLFNEDTIYRKIDQRVVDVDDRSDWEAYTDSRA